MWYSNYSTINVFAYCCLYGHYPIISQLNLTWASFFCFSTKKILRFCKIAFSWNMIKTKDKSTWWFDYRQCTVPFSIQHMKASQSANMFLWKWDFVPGCKKWTKHYIDGVFIAISDQFYLFIHPERHSINLLTVNRLQQTCLSRKDSITYEAMGDKSFMSKYKMTRKKLGKVVIFNNEIFGNVTGK